MLNRLKFQKKLFLSLSLIIIVLIVLLSTAFYKYSASIVTITERKSSEQIAEKMSTQVDELYQQMDIAATSIVNNAEIQNIIYELNFNDSIQSDVMLDYDDLIRKNLQVINFYLRKVIKASVFSSKKGFYFYTGLMDDDPDFVRKRLKDMTWYANLLNAAKPVEIVPPHQNDWSMSPKPVLSLFRRFTNTSDADFGVFEIQMPYSVLENICTMNTLTENNKVLIFDTKGNLVYPYKAEKPIFDSTTLKQIFEHTKGASSGSNQLGNPYGNISFSFHKSGYTGFTLVLANKQDYLGKQLSFYRYLTLLFGIIIILVILIAFYALISGLTRPLKKLVETIEKVNLDNMSLEIPHEGNNEFIVLNESFNTMFTKLKDSINMLYESKIRETHSHFLALQAQMNPHFLYNTLNVIGASSEEHNDPVTAGMCNRLSDMTRYIISVSNPVVTLRDEIIHTANYLDLMKKHYEEYLVYEIDIPDEMYGITIPKITLQPLIENSINHGFENIQPPWNLTIKGSISTNGGWEVIIEDNGSGMDDMKLSELSFQLLEYKKNLEEGNFRENLSLGGMGILNTYARFAIHFKENAVFSITNRQPHGCIVKLGCHQFREREKRT